jgi:mannose-6-phosphate isomerase-like protein (cupin superfamily)
MNEKSAHITLDDAMAEFVAAGGEPSSVELFRHGTLQVKLYAPRIHDRQTPHERDEVYVVAIGSGLFFDGDTRRPFGPGTFLFARAGQPHRFENFSDDLAVWVFFYGPNGGEVHDSA